MGGAIGEWSNSAPRAEPCHWATWVAPIFSEGNSLDSQEIRIPYPTTKAFGGHFLWHPLPPPPAPPLAQGPTAGRFQGPKHPRGGQRAQFPAWLGGVWATLTRPLARLTQAEVGIEGASPKP